MKVKKLMLLTLCILIILYIYIYIGSHNTKFLHISIDDTIVVFADLTNNKDKYNSIFDNETLKFLKKCNEKYGAKFSLYCFYSYSGMELSKFTDKFKSEFEENSDWLKFGFHAFNSTKDYSSVSKDEIINDYNLVINELTRIVGKNSIEHVIRIEKFICSKENVQAIYGLNNGITGLLGSDTIDRKNYYLNDKQNKKLFEKGYYFDKECDIFIYKTDIRVENIKDIDYELENINGDKNLIVFTHEWKLYKENMDKIEKILDFAVKNRYTFKFLEKL